RAPLLACNRRMRHGSAASQSGRYTAWPDGRRGGPGSTRPRGRRGCIGGCREDAHELEARTVTSVDAADPTASTAPTPRPSAFAVFRKRDFTLLWLAQFVSTAGSALTDLAAGILVFQLTNSALAVGLTLMATAVPSLVVGLIAGVFVDRYDRKRIMFWSNILQAILVALIPFVISVNVLGIYVV